MNDILQDQQKKKEPNPKLRHEFVGMMFAVTIGEIGIQVANLIHAGHFWHYSPAYTHLFLATVVVATSWVGWSRSIAPGATRDVDKIFELPFVVLLIDVSLVITYFILVRSVDFPSERIEPRVAAESTVSQWMAVIFGLYLLWDVVTKIFVYKWADIRKNVFSASTYRRGADRPWLKTNGARMLPTILCFALSLIMWALFKNADAPHFITADAALLFLALLFRASKDIVTQRLRPALFSGLPCASLGWSLELGGRTVFAFPIP